MKEKTDGERKEKGQKEEKKVREVKMGKEEEKTSKSEDQGKASGVCMKIFQISSITAVQWSYHFRGFSVLTVLGAAVDIPPGIVDVGQVAWALLPLQLGQD